MKTILLLVHDDSGQEARLQVALDLTRLLDGHLHCVDVTFVPPLVGGAFYEDAYAVADLVTLEATREDTNRSRITARLTNEDVRWDWEDAAGQPAECIAHAAALADIIIVSRCAGTDPGFGTGLASELIVKSAKPILIAPPTTRSLQLDRVLVAWDGSPAAAAALRAAVPILMLARSVVIATIDDGSVKAPPQEAASYLSRHGIHAQIDCLPGLTGDAGDMLLEMLPRQHCDLLVLGGFGHRRWIEALFGGVSRTVLMRSPIPILMAH